MSDTKPNVISRTTLVPLGVMCAVVFSCAGGVVWLNSKLSSIDYRLATIQKDLDEQTGDRWRESDMEVWAEMLRIQNPDLVIPKPRATSQ